jgi:small subunit ribosomal protein S21
MADTDRRPRPTSVKIEVVDNQIEPALKALKKAMLSAGIFKEMKRRAHYEKPSVKRKRKQAEARKKRRKALKRAGGLDRGDD